MSSINCSSLTSKLLRRFFVILVYLSSAVSNPPCGLYGAPPCQFLPAPPGQTPSCARPGRTYCEHIDNYPTYLIKHLVHKWGYEAKNIIVDETWDEFESLNLGAHDIQHFYDPALIFSTQPHNQFGSNNFNGYKYDGPNGIKTSSSTRTYSSSASSSSSSSSSSVGSSSSNSGYPEPIFIPKPHNTDAANFLIYTATGQQQAINKNKYTNIVQPGQNSKVTNYTPGIWLKRYVRDLSSRGKATSSWNSVLDRSSARNITLAPSRDVSINLDLLDIVGVNKENHSHRVKRQSAGRSTLCQTSSQFVMPQAALNSKGNWMFVVNEQNTARQLVKAELCVSTTCANLCQLPNGYTSRCEQKFVQKRLIALQGNGQNLYTDSFWFPSCCVCTIASS